MVTPGGQIHSLINLAAKTGDKTTKILNTYDIIAMRPDHTQDPKGDLHEQCFTKGDADIISLDLSHRMNFYFQKTWIKLAIQRSIFIEIVYGPGCFEPPQDGKDNVNQRKTFLMNAISLIKLAKGKHIILSSEASSVLYQRSPLDVMSMAKMVDIENQNDAQATVRANCAKVFQKAHMRKTFKGVAEIVVADEKEKPVEANAEESKMQLD